VRRIFPSFMAVLVGFIAFWLLVLITALVAAAIFRPTAGPTTLAYTVTNLVLYALAAIGGGWLTAWRAPHQRMRHVAALALILAALALAGMRNPTPGQPAWFPQALVALGPLGALLGGYLGSRRMPNGARPAA